MPTTFHRMSIKNHFRRSLFTHTLTLTLTHSLQCLSSVSVISGEHPFVLHKCTALRAVHTLSITVSGTLYTAILLYTFFNGAQFDCVVRLFCLHPCVDMLFDLITTSHIHSPPFTVFHTSLSRIAYLFRNVPQCDRTFSRSHTHFQMPTA